MLPRAGAEEESDDYIVQVEVGPGEIVLPGAGADEESDDHIVQVEEITRVGPGEILLPAADAQEESEEEKKEKRSVWRKER